MTKRRGFFRYAVFVNIMIISLVVFMTGCSKDLTIHEVMEKKASIDNPEKAAVRIYNTNNKGKYSKSDIDNAETLNKRAYRLYRAKRDSEAIPFYLRSLKVFPMAKVYFNLGNSLMNVHNYARAEVSYLTALQYYPKNYIYNYNLACAYSLQDKVDLSLKYLERALDMGYNAFEYIWNDPDMKNARRSGRFNKIMEGYRANKLTEEMIKNVKYCEVDLGHHTQRFTFNGDMSFTSYSEGEGPYGLGITRKDTERGGMWSIDNGKLEVKYEGSNYKTALYIKMSTHECTY